MSDIQRQESKPDQQAGRPQETASNEGLFQSLSKADHAYKPEQTGSSYVDNDGFQIVGDTQTNGNGAPTAAGAAAATPELTMEQSDSLVEDSSRFQYLVMEADLSGDGRVTADELSNFTTYGNMSEQMRHSAETLQSQFSQLAHTAEDPNNQEIDFANYQNVFDTMPADVVNAFKTVGEGNRSAARLSEKEIERVMSGMENPPPLPFERDGRTIDRAPLTAEEQKEVAAMKTVLKNFDELAAKTNSDDLGFSTSDADRALANAITDNMAAHVNATPAGQVPDLGPGLEAAMLGNISLAAKPEALEIDLNAKLGEESKFKFEVGFNENGVRTLQVLDRASGNSLLTRRI